MRKQRRLNLILRGIAGAVIALLPVAYAAETPAAARELPRAANEPITVWENFLTALQRGAMSDAYQLLLPSMRAKITYRDFCVGWHPLSRNYAAVLMPPLFSEFCVAGDLAFLRLGVKQNGAPDFMYAYLARDNDRWWLVGVDPQLAAEIITEAAAKDFLKQLWRQSPLTRESLQTGKPAALADLQREIPALFAQENSRRTLANYEFEIDNLRGGVIRLRPRHAALRGFEYDGENLRSPNALPPRTLTTEQIAAPVAVRKSPERGLPLPELDDELLAPPAGKTGGKSLPIGKTNRRALPPEVKISRRELPEPAPDFGNPDEWENPSASAEKNEPRGGELMPEFDGRQEMLMSPPDNFSPNPPKIPRAEVTINRAK